MKELLDNADSRLLRMSDLEELTGLNRKTIHYYLNQGLLADPLRTGKTMSYYNQKHVSDLNTIKELRGKGYPIVQIKRIMNKGYEGGKEEEEKHGEHLDANVRKQQLMEKAVELFSKLGFHKTKVSDITNAVGMSPSSFYVYFPSKKALFVDCMDLVFQSMFQDVVDEIKGEKHPLRRLSLRAEIALKSHRQFFDILQVLEADFEGYPRIEAKGREIYALIHEPLKRNLEWAVSEGLFPPLNLDIVAYILINVLETAHLILRLEGELSVDEFLDTIDNLLFYRE
ncbi:MAG: MerR family transcriptional regulator [Actinomycetota bacterium]